MLRALGAFAEVPEAPGVPSRLALCGRLRVTGSPAKRREAEHRTLPCSSAHARSLRASGAAPSRRPAPASSPAVAREGGPGTPPALRASSSPGVFGLLGRGAPIHFGEVSLPPRADSSSAVVPRLPASPTARLGGCKALLKTETGPSWRSCSQKKDGKMEDKTFPLAPKTQARPWQAVQPGLQPAVPTVSSTARPPRLQEASELQLTARTGPSTENRAHQDTFPAAPHRAVKTRLPCTRCPRHHPHPTPPLRSRSPPGPTAPQRETLRPSARQAGSFPSSHSSGELSASAFGYRVIYGAVRQSQLTDLRRVEMAPPARRRASERRHQRAGSHRCRDI